MDLWIVSQVDTVCADLACADHLLCDLVPHVVVLEDDSLVYEAICWERLHRIFLHADATFARAELGRALMHGVAIV